MTPPPPEERHDVVVVGGGPAGVSCALEGLDLRLDVVLLEVAPALGGQLAEIAHDVRNLATAPFQSRAALVAGLTGAAALLGDRVRVDQAVTAADLAVGRVQTATTTYAARAVVLATGTRRLELPAAPDGSYGGDVSYQVEQRPGWFDGRPVAVVGGGDSAAYEALELAGTCPHVVLVHRSAALTARADLVGRIEADPRIEVLLAWELEALHGDERLAGATVVRPATGERRRLDVGGLVVKITRLPNTEAFRGQVDLDGRGALVCDGDLRASLPGVFGAGDVVSGSYWRIATALGDGVLAARSVLRHLQGRP